MTSVLPDPGIDFGARVARRLRDEPVAWLTLVDGSGTPQPAPIWFLWDGESALIYSDHRAKRLQHLRRQPRVALHLDGDGDGGDIVVLTGEIAEVSDEPGAPDNPAYLAKYGDRITGGPWGSPEVFAETYSVALRFRPQRVRGH
ncbi:MAG TPA: TIGR03667 family PPOX class F420-dependent oxidoreductase [Pseudonocardia sp.]|nr:TIGR03667 family PPOX class F420-dependent oxidoreductase [Pseudonocardia sp.]